MTFRIIASVFFMMLISCRGNDSCGHVTNRQVCVTIINQSGQAVRHVLLDKGAGYYDAGALADQSQTSEKYESAGEGVYRIMAVLENGDTIKSPGSYTEGGWKMTELITRDSIKSKFQVSY